MPIINVYVSSNRVLRYMKQKLTELKGEFDRSTIVYGDSNILSNTDGPSKQKNCRKVHDMNTIFTFP